MSLVKAAAQRIVPSRHRHELYRARSVGPRNYAAYVRREWAARRGPQPQAGETFEVAPGASIMLHESTVNGLRAHWINRGEGILELEAFRRLAPGHRTFLDIGAAEGIFSAAFCAMTGGTAHAFEPAPGFYERATDFASINPSLDIVAHQLALGAASETIGAKHNGQMLYAVEDDHAESTMHVDTLDAFVARTGISPDLAKIDAEGMEIEVLRGGRNALASIDTVLLEVHRDLIRPWGSLSDLAEITEKLGYDAFTLALKPVPDLRRHLEHERAFRDVLNIVLRK